MFNLLFYLIVSFRLIELNFLNKKVFFLMYFELFKMIVSYGMDKC